MTAQVPEILLYKGHELDMFSTPLGPYLETTQHPIKLDAPDTAMWRGYIGTWSIDDGRLYLVSLEGNVLGPQGFEKVGLKDLFPNATDGLFAHWFSGELRCPLGDRLVYRHMGFGSEYEQDLLIKIVRGVVEQEHTVTNGTAPKVDAKPPQAIYSPPMSGKQTEFDFGDTR